MGTTTQNYNLYKPAGQEVGWGDEVDASMDVIDAQLKTNADAIAAETTARANAVAPLAEKRSRYIDQGAAKTAAYSMSVWHRAVFNTTSGAITQALPDSPAAGDEVQVYLSAGTNTLTLTHTSGNLTISVAGHGITAMWTGSAWAEIQDRKTLSSLDARYSGGQVFLPASNGVDDVAAINAVLAANSGKVIRGISGATYVTSAAIVVYSDTTLDMTNCTINGPSTDNILKNFAATAARSVTDAVTTAGSSTVTSATAAFTSGDVGKAIGIIGAGPNYGLSTAPGTMYGTITAVNSATSVTVSVSATSSKTGATLNVFPARDSNITVIGGTWNAGNRDTYRQETRGHAFFIRRADDVRIKPRRITSTGTGTGGRYAVAFGDVNRVEAGEIDFNVCSDGVHVQGPASRIDIHNLTGTTGDDMTAFTSVDGQSYAASLIGDVEGNIAHANVRDVTGTGAWRGLKITSGVGSNNVKRYVDGLSASRIKGSFVNEIVNITDYAGTGTVRSINIDDVTGTTGNGLEGYAMITSLSNDFYKLTFSRISWTAAYSPTVGVINITGAGQTVRIDDVVARANLTSVGYLVALKDVTTQSVAIDGLYVPDAPANYHGVGILGSSVTSKSLSVRNVHRTGAGANVVNISATAYSIGTIRFSDIYQLGGSLLVASVDSANTLNIKATNVYQDGGAFVIVQSPANVQLDQCEIVTPSGGTIRAASAAATPIRAMVRGFGSNTLLLTRTASQSLSVHAPDVKTDISILTPIDGDQVINSNSGLSCGTGPVIYSAAGTGNKWKHLYSGTTY